MIQKVVITISNDFMALRSMAECNHLNAVT